MNVYSRLNQARTAFHALKLRKTGLNKFAGYNYFELGDFLIPALKCFADAGLCAVVSFSAEVATLSIVDIDSGQTLELTSPMGSAALKGCHEVQNIGAVETYQRRYLWVAALEIVEHDALDATTGSDTNGKESGSHKAGAISRISEDQLAKVTEVANKVRKGFASLGPEAAADFIANQEFDADEHVALWALFGPTESAMRAAIKSAQAAIRLNGFG